MAKLHVELVKLQEWVKLKGLKVCIVFEGRDGAGKGEPSRRSPNGSVRGPSAWWLFLPRQSGKKHRCMPSAIFRIFRQPVKW